MTKKKNSIYKDNNKLGIVIAFLLLCVIMSISSENFLKPMNLLNIIQQVSINFTIAIGMTFVILQGGIDLSVGSSVAFVGLIMAICMKNLALPVWFSIIVGLLAATLVGAVNGLLIAYIGLPPFIVTLGTMSIARGAAYTITAGQPIFSLPANFLAVSGRVFNIPVAALVIMVVLFCIAAYILKYTRLGRFTYAIGGNENCARLSGINIKLIKCSAYAIMGFCCGVASILLTSRLDSAVPTNADGYEMDAIAAVVIGGTSMSGGEGTLGGTLIGALIIGVIANGLNLLGVAQGPQRMMKGLIIVIAVVIDLLRRKKAVKV